MEKIKRQTGIFKNAETFIAMALFIALSIVFGKYIAINIGSNFRISLENTPVLLAAVVYGPLAGAVVGAVSDLIGCLLVGYPINPIITAGALTLGLLAGITAKFLLRDQENATRTGVALRCLAVIGPAHLAGSVVIKTLGLYLYYGSPFLPTCAIRLGIYAATAVIESAILYILLYKNKIIKKFKPRQCR